MLCENGRFAYHHLLGRGYHLEGSHSGLVRTLGKRVRCNSFRGFESLTLRPTDREITMHKIPPDLRKVLSSTPRAQKMWGDITPLARNEWICWVTSAKKSETRARRIERTRESLLEGKRRPCCWAGCPHR